MRGDAGPAAAKRVLALRFSGIENKKAGTNAGLSLGI
jgi:hypothetical protein